MTRLREQSQSQRQSIGLMELNLGRSLNLEREGVLSPAQADEAREDLAQAQRSARPRAGPGAGRPRNSAALEHRRQDRSGRRADHPERGARDEALAFLLAQTVVRAPGRDGRGHAGQARGGGRTGQGPGQADPPDLPLQRVLPGEKDRAFVKPGG